MYSSSHKLVSLHYLHRYYTPVSMLFVYKRKCEGTVEKSLSYANSKTAKNGYKEKKIMIIINGVEKVIKQILILIVEKIFLS